MRVLNMNNSTLKPGKGFGPRTKPMSRGKSPKATAGLLRVAAVQREAKTKSMKSRGMKGRAPTAAEQAFMDKIAALGCRACAQDGIENPDCSPHHIDGRTKPGAHFLVIGLCAGHHQKGTGNDKTLIAVHPDKARFEARYGTQRELLAECIAIISGADRAATPSVPKQISLEQ
jgi:hypothetical protein